MSRPTRATTPEATLSARAGAAAAAAEDDTSLVDFDVDAVDELYTSWQQRCEATGCATGPADGPRRYAMLAALEGAAAPSALARVRGIFSGRTEQQTAPRSPGTVGARRRALDGAARRWGSWVASPGLVVEQMLLLRHLVAGTSEGERIGRLVDRSMLIATRAATDELQRAAFSDPLTGCANRRALERDIARELARCERAELDLSVVAVDVDGLKSINDTYGHPAGDAVLLRLVESFRRALRGLDTVYRVGGDEFIVVLPDTPPEDAVVVVGRVESLGAPSFSWGVASVAAIGSFDAAALLEEADEQLYDRRRVARGLDLAAGRHTRARTRRQGAPPDAHAGAIG
jgi:diguanylate cyclase (GGDEF)-like protein